MDKIELAQRCLACRRECIRIFEGNIFKYFWGGNYLFFFSPLELTHLFWDSEREIARESEHEWGGAGRQDEREPQADSTQSPTQSSS